MPLGKKPRRELDINESKVRRDPPLYERMDDDGKLEDPFAIFDELQNSPIYENPADGREMIKSKESSYYEKNSYREKHLTDKPYNETKYYNSRDAYGERPEFRDQVNVKQSEYDFSQDELFGEFGAFSNQSVSEEEVVAYNPTAEKRERALSKSSKKASKKNGKKRKKKKGKRIATIIFALLLLILLIGGFIAMYVWGLLGKVTPIELGDDLGIDPVVAQELSNYDNILIAGVDARVDESYDTSRTDAIMILSVDKVTEEVKLISVYRDTYLQLETADGIQYYSKVNAANTNGGITQTVKALNTNMDLNIDEVILLNWNTVASVVDGLGGLEVDIKEEEIDELNKYIIDTANNIGGDTTLITEPGVQTLNGVQAVTYARIRKVGNGDFERTERMRTLVESGISKTLQSDFNTINTVAETGASQVVTSLDQREILDLAIVMATYTQGESIGFPYLEQPDGTYLTETGIIDGQSMVVPRTLNENVVMLHETMFNQPSYEPTTTVQEISDEIAWYTGFY